MVVSACVKRQNREKRVKMKALLHLVPFRSKRSPANTSSTPTPGSTLPQKTANGLTWRVLGSDSGAYLQVALRKGQAVMGAAGHMIYLKGEVSQPETHAEGFFGKFFAGEEVFANQFEGTSDTVDGVVAFSQALPGAIIGIELSSDTPSIKFNRGSLLAYTPDVEISGKVNWLGFIPFGQGEGIVLPTATCKNGARGTVWLSAYGTFEMHELAAGETLLADNGVFLACETATEYSIKAIGKSLKSVMFGGQGFGMLFTGPCHVYTQSRCMESLVAVLASKLPS